jgi:hypothetical protein
LSRLGKSRPPIVDGLGHLNEYQVLHDDEEGAADARNVEENFAEQRRIRDEDASGQQRKYEDNFGRPAFAIRDWRTVSLSKHLPPADKKLRTRMMAGRRRYCRRTPSRAPLTTIRDRRIRWSRPS